MLHVMPIVANNYDSLMQFNFTYDVIVVPDNNGRMHWSWRKWLAGFGPFGNYSKSMPFSTKPVQLDREVTILFATAMGKHVGDTWRFDVVIHNEFRAPGRYVSGTSILCRLPPPDRSHPDADPDHEGTQQEIKVSMSGRDCFSKPKYRHTSLPSYISSDSADDAVVSQDFIIDVDGYFTGPEDYSFEIVMTSRTAFKWRKYRPGMPDCTITGNGQWCRFVGHHYIDERGIYLKHGVFVKFATTDGKNIGDRWEFTAFTCWSTSFSPVKYRGKHLTSDADALLYVEGTFLGNEDATFEVEILADPVMFRWRSYTLNSNSSSAEWAKTRHMISTCPIYLERGVSIQWLTTGGKYLGDRWNWTAYSGRLITTLAKPHTGQILPSKTNTPGDQGVPYLFGTYLGQASVRIIIEIGGNCSTSCFEFRWKKEHLSSNFPHQTAEWRGFGFSPLYKMKDSQPFTDGLYISWPILGGYAHGNTYIVTLSQIPTSVLPVRPLSPSIFSSIVSGSTFLSEDHEKLPAKNSVLTIELWNSTAFKWRKDTEPYSESMSVDFNRSVRLTDGISIMFSKFGFVPGIQYLIPLQTHIPHVFKVKSDHNGSRASSIISRPAASPSNVLNGPNYGSLVGDVVCQFAGPLLTEQHPVGNNQFQQNNAIIENECAFDMLPSIEITAGVTKGFAIQKFAVMYLKILGSPSLSVVTGEFPEEIEILGKYTGISSYVYEVEPHGAGDHFTWRKYSLGSTNADATLWSRAYGIQVSSSSPLDCNLSISFKSTTYSFSSNTRWTFTANQGHTFVYRVSGRGTWSGEKSITSQPQELASGISVQFSQLSGYSSGTPLKLFKIH